MPSVFTNMPSGGGVSSPVANGGRRRCTSGMEVRLGSPGFDWRRRFGRRGLRRAEIARPQWRFRPSSDSGEGRKNAHRQTAVAASLGPRRGAQSLGRRCERADGRARCGGGNGGRRSGVRTQGGSAALFIGAGSTEGACGLRLKGWGGELWRGAQRPRRTGLAGGRHDGGSGREHGRVRVRVGTHSQAAQSVGSK
jgi:hypothetical protein